MSDSLTVVSSVENDPSHQGRASIHFDSAEDADQEGASQRQERESPPAREQEPVQGKHSLLIRIGFIHRRLVLCVSTNGGCSPVGVNDMQLSCNGHAP